ncbi:hypothetical protein TNCV_3759621 [Trichonephila clavipes]|nr:hypothetical protein TNCV_3759621 [Trichonephila clavipes]
MRARNYYDHPSISDHWALVHEQMSRLGGLSEERPPVFKTPSKLGTHLSTHCSGDERQSRPWVTKMAQLSPTKVIRAKGVGSPRSEPRSCPDR